MIAPGGESLKIYAEQFLKGYRGRYLQCDGYDGYECLTRLERDEGRGRWSIAGAICDAVS